ncbi:energy transducer TonB [Eilatimonas milleporae]|uniref:TonB family protein n=1 Tax=Eilatimonas milleporae TaxID=911205 RepID=A0A3M0CD93_9PROT|nr:TonB family protein [Eilatimonas milleporae]RMB07718.1 TonB family protein [Eilatimonas milleporae]
MNKIFVFLFTAVLLIAAPAAVKADTVGELMAAAEVSGIDQAALSAWQQKARAALTKLHVYPRSAKMENVEGTGRIQVTMEKGGRVVHVAVLDAPAHKALDRAIQAYEKKLQNLPAMPSGFDMSHFTFIAEINWTLA